MHGRAARPLALLAVAILSVSLSLTGVAEAETRHAASEPSDALALDSLGSDSGASRPTDISEAKGPDQTPGTSYQISRDEIRRLAARGVEDVTALQAGVVLDRRTNDLYVRGGDASGLIYYVDGVPLQDAFTGISSARLSNAAINEMSVITGGLGVDYGWGMSGATSVTTPDGSGKLHGSAEAITDDFHGGRFDYNVYVLSLNGPLLPNSDKLTFTATGERGWMGDRQPHTDAGGILPHNSSGTWMWNGKLRWKPTDRIVARLGALGSSADLKEYFPSYAFDVNHAPRTTDRSSAFWGEITHTLSQRTSYSVRGYWAKQEQKTGDGVYFDNLWGYGRPKGNPRYDASTLFWDWDDMKLDPDSLAHGVIYQLHTPVVDTVMNVPLPSGDTIQKSFVASGDEGSVWDDYVRRQGSYVGGKADLVSQIGAEHSLKVGAEFQRHTLRYYHHFFPTDIYLGKDGGFKDADFYGFDELGQDVNGGLNGAKHPLSIAGYAQDRLDWQDLVLNAGIRADYLDYASRRLRNPSNPLDPDNNLTRIKNDTTLTRQQADSLAQEAGRLTESDLEQSKPLVRVSPRLGASFQIAAGSLLHFSFGRYYKRPDFGALYSNFGFLEYKLKTGGYFAVVGNGNLKPIGMTSMELGVEQRITDFLTFDLTGFYKDISDLIGIITQPAFPNSFTTYANVGDITSKGLEFQLGTKRTWGFAGELKYTIQSAESGSLLANSQSNIAWTVGAPPGRLTGPIWYDRRHTFTAIIDARVADKGGPMIGSFHPLERSGLNFVFTAASGFPYTPVRVYNSLSLGSSGLLTPAGPFNSRRIPATYRLDLKADKAFPIGGTSVDIYLWVLNVFDRRNVLDVYTTSGSPDDTGWLATADGQAFVSGSTEATDSSLMTGEQKYRFRQDDPLNYDTPRQIRLGLLVSF